MYYWEGEAEDESVEGYQKSVRARAGDSLETLKQALTSPVKIKSPVMSPEMKLSLTGAVHPRHLAYSGVSVDSPAASQLRQQLYQGRSHITHEEPMIRHLREAPTIEETTAILQTQAGYVQQIEAENIFMKEELTRVRLKMNELIEENRELHEELKSSVLKEIIHEGGNSIHIVGNQLTSEVFEAAAERGNLQKWQKELARLNSLHEAKAKLLEAQLLSAKSDAERYELTVEDLKSQLIMRDTDIQVATREDGTPGFMYSGTQTTIHIRTIDRLKKERDDQLDLVAHFKIKIKDMEQREDEAYLQIKKGIELVEQAQLEQTEAIVEKEQLAEELLKMRERFSQLVTDNQTRIDEERKTVRKESHLIVVELNTKIKELTEGFVTCQNQADRLSREKTALSYELDDAKLQLKKYDKEVAMTTDTYRSESTNANIQRQQSLHEVTRLRTDLQQCEKERDQDRSKYRAEVEDLRRRLQKAEKELMNSKEECIHHTSNVQALERELHLAKMARDSVERGRTEDLKVLMRRTQQREQELSNYIHDIEGKQATAEKEMDGMLKDQNNLIGRLRTECRHQANQLAKVVKKNRAESGQLKNENATLSMRLEKAVSRVTSLEEQTDQHSRLHEKMRQRLKMMDDHAQHQSQQVLDLLSRQSSLMKDRQLLARELEFLRSKLMPGNESDVEKLFTSRVGAVDDILSAVTEETRGDNNVWTDLLKPTLDPLDKHDQLIGSP